MPAPRGRIFFLFLDGVGIGRDDGRENPFFSVRLPGFEALLGGPMVSLGAASRSNGHSSVRPLDATLGIGGLPQSGTGQTAILTGENAARIIGRHFGPFPHSGLRALLAEKNIFSRLGGLGLRTMYINAFPGQYLDHLKRHPARTGAISLAWRSNGRPLNGCTELISGRALSADCTSEGWGRLGYPEVPVVTPEEAAGAALSVLADHEFVLFEYYLTDHAGHGRSRREAAAILSTLDRFVGRFVRDMDPSRDTLILTSDHGNFEDLSTKQHTLNPVPFVSAGLGHDRLARSVRDLTGILPTILEYFSA
ncbi:MAG TPA: alkaline phosphatase family protein [Bacteroidota bacterium]|nr:alkaline phosphatase family protein [Bacteroidota bacterium]